ncbi:uncharacterized protein LOC117504829 isoform X2 [Thalassophryne amazonica]|uniref:uncharacterized protein LOC117504829 isoform X2 n=1 Tax=Thalassophryne amazonica TaxID=390379 RepID=UPI0014711EFE|nr:uncharacterized protein LOC117504829 isoform X2 [Thalassophryne amazonica]
MSKVQQLRDFLKLRLTAADKEIFELFEGVIADYEGVIADYQGMITDYEAMIADYQEEINHLKDNKGGKVLDAAFNPQVRLCRADTQQLVKEEDVLPEQQEEKPSLYQNNSEPSNIKEEQEQLRVSQSCEHGTLKVEADEDDCGQSQPASQSDVQQVLVNEDVLPEEQEWNQSRDQMCSERPNIKEEQKELCSSQEAKPLHSVGEAGASKFPVIVVFMKCEGDEKQQLQLHQSQSDESIKMEHLTSNSSEHGTLKGEADGDNCGGSQPATSSEPCSQLPPDNDEFPVWHEDAVATVSFDEPTTPFGNDSESGQAERHVVVGQENSQVTRRFPLLSPTDLEQLEACAQSKNTTKQTKWGVQVFREWLVENGKDGHFESLPESSLAESLRGFYASARNKDGNLYSKSTYVGIRAAINRHLRGAPFHRAVSILNGPAFHQANSMFSAMLKKLKREGLHTTKHHDPISESDFQKLQASDVFSTDNPRGLQRKVWFDISLSFARRGRENLRELKSDAFNFKVDESGRSYVEMRYSKATKNHLVDNLKGDDFESKPRMYAIENSLRCPVQSLKKYLEKRNPANNIFFQKAKVKVNTEDEDTWYTTRPVGEKTLHNFMKTISAKAGLSKVYTNHCVKATAIARLAHAGVEAKEIMRISGHRNEQSIRSYNSDSSEEQKRMYSAILHGQENMTFPKPAISSPHCCNEITTVFYCSSF